LKYTGITSTGGEVKTYLQENKVFINNLLTSSRGFKIKINYLIKIDNKTYKIVSKKESSDDE
jgi:ribosome-associated protein YbcJ (S4-like RNA binding protein)